MKFDGPLTTHTHITYNTKMTFRIYCSGLASISFFQESIGGPVIGAMQPGEKGFNGEDDATFMIPDPAALHGPRNDANRAAFEEAQKTMLRLLPEFVRYIISCIRDVRDVEGGESSVLVHCYGGKQRSAYLTLVLCHLICGLPDEDACVRFMRENVSPDCFKVWDRDSRKNVDSMSFRGVLDRFVASAEYPELARDMKDALAERGLTAEFGNLAELYAANKKEKMNSSRW